MTGHLLTSSVSGFVYVLVHPRFPGWVKVGCTTSPNRRLSSYNTGDPQRSYRMLVAVPVVDQWHAEWMSHERLLRLGYAKSGEWFDASPSLAERVVRRVVAQVEREGPFT